MGLYDLILPVIESAAGSAALGGALWALSGRFHVSVPPNRALVLFGNHHSSSAPEVRGRPGDVTVRRARIVVGGRALVAPWNRAVGYLSLEPVVADVTVRSMQSLEGTHAAGWEVRIRAAAKIPTEPGLLVSAAENLLGKDEEEVRTIVRQAVEAAVPTVLARLRAGTTEPDWDRLAAEVQASVASDLVGWGLSVRSLSVTELHRIAPPEPLARPPVTATTAGVTAESAPRLPRELLERFDSRLSTAEHHISALAAEAVRVRRESLDPVSEATRPASVFDVPLGAESAAWAAAADEDTGVLDDSTGGGDAPRSARASFDARSLTGARGLRPAGD